MKTILFGNIIINDKNEIYLLFRKKHEHYETPGGKYDGKSREPSIEELKETARRELLEELKGIKKILSMKHFATIEFTIPDGREAIAHKFLTKIEGNPEPNEDIFDEKKSKWLTKNELEKVKLSPDLKKIENFLFEYMSNNKMIKKALIIHGWEGTPEKDWFPWLKKELEKKGYKTIVPEMPDTEEPKIKSWVPLVKELLEKNNVELIFGHSIGCQTILRALEQTAYNPKKVILVAPWTKLTEEATPDKETKEIAEPWINTLIDWQKIRVKSKYVCFFSDNDPFVFVSEEKIFKEKLGAKIIILKSKGHFSGEQGITELKEILEEIN